MSEPYRLVIEIPALTRMANAPSGGSSHWRVIYNERKKWHSMVGTACRAAGLPAEPLKRAQLTLTRYSSTCPDYDGLVRGMKYVVDGLIAAKVIEDDNMGVTGVWECRWEKVRQGQGKIRVEVLERTL